MQKDIYQLYDGGIIQKTPVFVDGLALVNVLYPKTFCIDKLISTNEIKNVVLVDSKMRSIWDYNKLNQLF